MRASLLASLVIGALAAQAPLHAQTRDVKAGALTDLSVTVYRAPDRREGGFDLNNLQGFALVTETRRVVLEPGVHRLRFEGVADGIEPASAIVTGLPSGVIEKNRDAKLLSPSALVEAAEAEGGRVLVNRTNPATGAMTRQEGKIRAASNGVVIETPDGLEALRCSGLPETFAFDTNASGLVATPTLSVLTRTETRIEAQVQLSYLARGFDWSADYVASMKAGAKTLDLGGWITLANGNGVSFKDARVQVVAGRLNRESGAVEPIDLGRPIIAACWPQGSTSDPAEAVYIERAYPLGFDAVPPPPAPPMAAMAPRARDAMADKVMITGSMIAEQEELGDLKLYRLPGRTTLASRQSKQVRFMDKAAVPVTKIYAAEFYANDHDDEPAPAAVLLRTVNDAKHKLGLPLPSGRVALFETSGQGARARRLLIGEPALRDLAINEEVELQVGPSPDVQVVHTIEERTIAGPAPPPRIPGIPRAAPLSRVGRLEITNARATPVQLEIRLDLDAGQSLASASTPAGTKYGQPIFRLTVPANATRTIRYQTTER